MRPNTLSPHEMLDLHELLSSEVTNAEKMQANLTIVNDNELKSFMQSCLTAKQARITKLSQVINNAAKATMQ